MREYRQCRILLHFRTELRLSCNDPPCRRLGSRVVTRILSFYFSYRRELATVIANHPDLYSKGTIIAGSRWDSRFLLASTWARARGMPSATSNPPLRSELTRVGSPPRGIARQPITKNSRRTTHIQVVTSPSALAVPGPC